MAAVVVVPSISTDITHIGASFTFRSVMFTVKSSGLAVSVASVVLAPAESVALTTN